MYIVYSSGFINMGNKNKNIFYINLSLKPYCFLPQTYTSIIMFIIYQITVASFCVVIFKQLLSLNLIKIHFKMYQNALFFSKVSYDYFNKM